MSCYYQLEDHSISSIRTDSINAIFRNNNRHDCQINHILRFLYDIHIKHVNTWFLYAFHCVHLYKKE